MIRHVLVDDGGEVDEGLAVVARGVADLGFGGRIKPVAYKVVVKIGARQRWQHIGDVSHWRGDVNVAAGRRVVGGDDCAIEEGGVAVLVCIDATSTV